MQVTESKRPLSFEWNSYSLNLKDLFSGKLLAKYATKFASTDMDYH